MHQFVKFLKLFQMKITLLEDVFEHFQEILITQSFAKTFVLEIFYLVTK